MLGLDLDTQTSPIETVDCRSNWCSNVMPLLTVLSSPPEAVATQYMQGSVSLTAKAVMRPAMFAGPTQRQLSALVQASGIAPSTTVVVLLPSGCWPEPIGKSSQVVRPTTIKKNAQNRTVRSGRTMMPPNAGARRGRTVAATSEWVVAAIVYVGARA